MTDADADEDVDADAVSKMFAARRARRARRGRAAAVTTARGAEDKS